MHQITINNKKITVDFQCNHPKIKNNTCPTGSGDCAHCDHCIATMSAPDFFILKEGNKNE